jgi:DNA primase catalytic subunit
MVTLKQAIQLLGLKDDDAIYICRYHCETGAPYYRVKQIRNKFDMKNTIVKRIYPYHFFYSGDLDWELII